VLLCSATPLPAQRDSLSTNQSDTAQYRRLDPRKALFYSAAFPGLGQMYNGKYWKLPFVYGGFAVGFSVVNFYQKGYVRYRNELFTLLATGQSASGASETTLRFVVDRARRERDNWIILSGIWYLLQITDAHVDAHLQDFKFNKNLNVSLQPALEQSVMTGRTAGFSIVFKF
jgi:hypothetical protein